MRPLTPIARALAVAAAALFVGAGAAAAQTTTTGAVHGAVYDAAGAPLAGVQVTATSLETGFVGGALTGDDGEYTVRLLPPGRYRVDARRIGQQPASRPDVRVVVGSATPVNFTLQTSAVTLSAVRVNAEAARVDATNAGVKTTVSEEQIDNLPALGRDFTDFINISGLVSPTPETTTGGQFSIAGQRPSQTNVQIDGVDANNSYFGENRGGSRIPFAFSLESIREFQIITNGYDVEYGNYSGGLVNIVTKGGTNDFKGSVYSNFRNDDLTGKNFDETRPNQFSAWQYAAQVEGPIRENKLFYLFSLDGQRRREPFVPLSPSTFAARGDTATATAFTEFERILHDRYGVSDASANYDRFQISDDVITLFGRLDWNIGTNSRLSLRDNFSTYKNGNLAGGSSVTAGLSQAEVLKDRSNSLVGELTTTLRPNLFNVLRLQYSTEGRPRVGNNLNPTLAVRITPNQTINYGGSFISFNNNLDEDKFQIVDNVTLQQGHHTFKLGTNNIFSAFRNNFWLNGSGTYTFNNLADFDSLRPVRFNRNVRVDGQPPRSNFETQSYSVYGQDEWQVTPKLLATLGLRYDVARYGSDPGRVTSAENAFGIRTGVAPNDDDNVSPRVSMTYDFNGDATSLLRAGGGLFYGTVPYVMGGNVAITDVPLLTLDCTGSAAEGATNAPPSVAGYPGWSANGSDIPFNCAGGSGVGGVPEYSFWSSDFAVPQTLKANLGYERLLGPWRMSVDGLFSQTSKLYTVRDINLRDPQFTLAAEGGRRVFVPAASFDPTSAAGADRLRNTDFADVYVNYNDGLARSYAGTFEVDRRFESGNAVTASYTFTRAYDNSSFSCCTSNEGFTSQRYGALGPNVIGDVGDESGGWGPSNFQRNHTFVLTGMVRLPWAIRLSTIARFESGTPWGPEASGDLNGDGVRFNDRPFVYRPEDLPIYVAPTAANPDSIVSLNRSRYASYLAKYDCVGKYVGKIIPRNTCRQPWFNRVDVSLRKSLETLTGQHAELSIDLFNVLNGINKNWGRYEAVQTSNRNLLVAQSFDQSTGKVQYTVPAPGASGFGESRTLGTNLLLQFSAQVGIRYSF